ncbi:HCR007Wp [Eremothecium sinecaudum]|uniref:DNA ligase n=1 Tax=Eremothecium sinecaudum TaxID=45286 RepID=A0A0X8HRL6_9SACH|nr:HCR007Wp [Eremothecium sinecaudum]AMD20157.1 HCR007Wp [Eremothecium sinecaudum]
MEKEEEESSPELILEAESKPVNFSPSPDFVWLCNELFVKLEDASIKKNELGKPRRLRLLEIISHFYRLWRTTVGNDIYPALILALPYLDKRTFRLKEATLVQAICRYLKLPRNSETEKRLIYWKKNAPRGSKLSKSCVEEIQKRKKEYLGPSRLSIDKVNECLDQLHHDSNVGKWGYIGLSKSKTFRYCMEHMSFTEMRYFFDIILKVSVVGGLEGLLLRCWHPDAETYFKVVSDLRVVTETLWNQSKRLEKNDLTVRIGYPFSPQLALRLKKSDEDLARGYKNDFMIEEKMDGERIQLHYKDYGHTISYWSRNGINYTYLYGENQNLGSISNCLQFVDGVKNCILDGEMVTYNRETNMILPFGLTKTSAGNQLTYEATGEYESSYRPLYMVFDLIYLNGKPLTALELWKRKEYLQKILVPTENVVEILPFSRCSEASSISASLGAAISRGSEGIILKDSHSKYLLGRRSDCWIKIKPEYLENFGENLDLVIIGRIRGKKDSFICALAIVEDINANDDSLKIADMETTPEPHIVEPNIRKFISFCSIANGISNEEFKQIERLTRGNWISYSENPPSTDWVEFGTKTPNEWIDPKHSIVLEVKARSIDNEEVGKERYKTGSTLHGAYCRCIRYDKDWKTACTLEEFKQAREAKEYYNHHYGNSVVKSKKSPSKKREFHVVGTVEDSKVTGKRFLHGCHFYVLSGYFDKRFGIRVDNTMVAENIVAHGGTYVHNLNIRAGLGKLYILGGKLTRECKILIDRGYDIIHPSWLMDSVMYGTMLRIEPRYIYNVGIEFMANVSARVDEYNDSYQIPIECSEYEHIIGESKELLLSEESPALNTNTVNEELPFLLFQRMNIFILADDVHYQDRVDLIKWKIRAYQGALTDDIANANLIVAIEYNYSKAGIEQVRHTVASLIGENIPGRPIPKITVDRWIEACIEEQCLVDEEDYLAV